MRFFPILFFLLAAPFLLSCGEEDAQAQGNANKETYRTAQPETGSVSPDPTSSSSSLASSTSSPASVGNGNAAAPFADTALPGETDPGDNGTDAPKTGGRRLSPIAYHKGTNHAHVHRRGHGYGSAASARQHDWLRSIGANAISITPFGFQRGAKSDHIVGFGPDETPGGGDGSMTLADMAAEVDSAHRRGLRVMLKPHIWSSDFWNGSEWHGTIDQKTPEEHRRWWACYRRLILYYAEFAERSGVDYLCVGTELARMTWRYPDEWRGLIDDVRKVFSGDITYAAHWDREWREIGFWDRLDFIGIGAYFPLNAPDSATVEQLATAWTPYRRAIDSVADRFGRPFLFVEFGYRPVAGTWREPWRYDGGTADAEAQRRGFEAMFRAFENDRRFRGVYVWKTFTDDTAARSTGEQTGFVFKGLPGESVLRQWWNIAGKR